ncbi:MAG: alpha-L-fucosidase [Clostridia bacterium]|nr:alpha-L-fucosidase [Clostridia bacterium]
MAKEFLEKAIKAVPDKRQLDWMDVEYAGVIHFGMNTFSAREEGTGFEEVDLFNPTSFSPEQWVKVAKLCGMKALVLNVKHHDGFCLWQTEHTDYSVKSCAWMNGEGDVVRSLSECCRKAGIKFGISISPLDFHEKTFGTGKAYDEFFMNLLRELLTKYGDIYCVSLDGATGEGRNGTIQKYDWESYFALIRELQPNAAITNCGPDVRWVGNDKGVTRISEWSVVPSHYRFFDPETCKYIPPKAQPDFTQPDIGSRKKIKKFDEFVFYPAEVTVPLRDGWFYKKAENLSVKPLSKLQKIYEGSVGANASMLLGICPRPDGVIDEKDVETLMTFGAVLSLHFEDNLALDSSMDGNCQLDDLHSPTRALPDKQGYWHSGYNTKKPEIILDMGDDYDVDRIVLKENVETGQQIEEFTVFAEEEGKWKKLCEGTVIGHKRICELKYHHRTRRLKLVIDEFRSFATIKEFSVY